MKKYLLVLALLSGGIITAGAQKVQSVEGKAKRQAPAKMVKQAMDEKQHSLYTDKETVVYKGTPSTMVKNAMKRAEEEVTLTAEYGYPDASYFWGMSYNWSGYSAVILQTSSQVENIFPNYSTIDEKLPAQYEWTVTTTSKTYELEQNEDGDAVNNDFWGYYPSPVLKVTQGGKEASFQFGERATGSNTNGYWYLGTDSISVLSHASYALGCYSGFSNLDKRFETNSDFDGKKVAGFAEYFEKPASATYVKSIDILGWLDGSKNIQNPFGDEELTAEIHVIDAEGNVSSEVYATATATSENYELANEENGNVGFQFVFLDEDNLFGYAEAPIMLPDQPFMIYLKGFEKLDGNFIVPFCSAYPEAGHSYVILEDGSLATIGYRNQPDVPQCNLHISLNAALATIFLDDPSKDIFFPEEGGLAYFYDLDENGDSAKYNNIFVDCNVKLNEKNEDEPWEIVSAPEWVTGYELDDKYQEQYWIVELYLQADPLPEGVEGRKGEVVISAYGRELTIPVKQGEVKDYQEPPFTFAGADGKYLLVNVESEKSWGAGNDWGTRASLVDHPEYVTLLQQPDGTYFMESQVSNGGNAIYFNGDYMDNGSPVALTINAAQILGFNDDAETQPVYGYTIANGENYFGYDGTSTVLGKNLPADSENALWLVVSEQEAMAALANASAEEPADVTFLIQDPNFGRNNRYLSAWTVSEDCTNSNLKGGDNTNLCAESYHSVFTISQLLENVPNGIYALQAQGFYRQDGEDNDNLPVFFANDQTEVFPLKTGAENSMNEASVSFKNGLYYSEPVYVEVKDGKLTIGAKLEVNTNLWCIFDNFSLKYYGADADLNEVKNAAIIAQLQDLIEKAESLQDQVEVEAVKTALANAIKAAEGVSATSTEEEIKAAIAALNEAVGAAEASAIAKNVLPAMKNLVDATNVYTEEALNTYYTQWNEKYQAGTLTKGEASALQNPDVVTGWHAAITVDDFLLSAWDTNPNFNNAPYYINTWSVEGDTDGSNFRVPFFEYWTGDDASLGARTLTATMSGLEAGEYEVKALVRVRTKNNTGSYTSGEGITLQVNEGEPVDVTKGDKKYELAADNNFFVGEFKAKGNVEGDLNIKFNVAAENNVSWLSFKNVWYTRLGVINGINSLNNEAQSNTIYNLNGQKVEKAQKGLYIMNGKKVVVK